MVAREPTGARARAHDEEKMHLARKIGSIMVGKAFIICLCVCLGMWRSEGNLGVSFPPTPTPAGSRVVWQALSPALSLPCLNYLIPYKLYNQLHNLPHQFPSLTEVIYTLTVLLVRSQRVSELYQKPVFGSFVAKPLFCSKELVLVCYS